MIVEFGCQHGSHEKCDRCNACKPADGYRFCDRCQWLMDDSAAFGYTLTHPGTTMLQAHAILTTGVISRNAR